MGNVKRKSDNLIMLLATVKQKIAKYYQREGKYDLALKEYENALDIL